MTAETPGRMPSYNFYLITGRHPGCRRRMGKPEIIIPVSAVRLRPGWLYKNVL